MDKKTACYKLADINEEIYELENRLEDINSRLRWDNEDRKDWYLERREVIMDQLERKRKEHDVFFNRYYDIIHS